jgi:hypothetical protein
VKKSLKELEKEYRIKKEILELEKKRKRKRT